MSFLHYRNKYSCRFLLKNGWSTFRVSNDRVRYDVNSVVEEIIECIEVLKLYSLAA